MGTSESCHPHDGPWLPVLHRVAKGEDLGFIGPQLIAETSPALARLPVQPRIHPSEAGRINRDNIVKHLTLVLAGKQAGSSGPGATATVAFQQAA